MGWAIEPIGPDTPPPDALLERLQNAATRHWKNPGTGRSERSWYAGLITSCGRERSGHMALLNGGPQGFIVWHIEDELGVLDAMYVNEEIDRPRVATLLFNAAEAALREHPSVRRIVNRFYVWPEDYISAPFVSLGYRVVQRINQSLELASFESAAVTIPVGCRTSGWIASFEGQAANLIARAYAGGEDDLNSPREHEPARVASQLREILKHDGQRYTTLLLNDDALVGFLAAAVYSPLDDSRQVVIQELCVAPAFRNLGLGSYLLDAVLGRMKAAGEAAVDLTVTATNDRARRRYAVAGFRPVLTIPYASKTVGGRSEVSG